MVFPVFLHNSGHQQKRSMCQRDVKGFDVFIEFMAYMKGPGLSKAHGCNWLVAGSGFCIIVPANGILAIAVQVQQNTVE
jgi:hypothetical protein